MGTRTVIAGGGGDFTTIQAAINYADTYWGGASDVYEVLIDSSTYAESLIVDFSTTPSSTKYLSVRGNSFSSAPTITGDGSANTIFSVKESYTQLKWVRFAPSHDADWKNNGPSVTGLGGSVINVVFDSIYYKSISSKQYDCCYVRGQNSGGIASAMISNSFFSGASGSRSGIFSDILSGGTSATLYIDNCTVFGNFSSASLRANTSGVYFNVYNCLASNSGGSAYSLSLGSGITGSNNIASGASAESIFTKSYDSVTFTTTPPTSGEKAVFYDTTQATVNAGIKIENDFTATQYGVNRVGSEPDPRQDFSVDIRGMKRKSVPTIGAFEYIPRGGGGGGGVSGNFSRLGTGFSRIGRGGGGAVAARNYASFVWNVTSGGAVAATASYSGGTPTFHCSDGSTVLGSPFNKTIAGLWSFHIKDLELQYLTAIDLNSSNLTGNIPSFAKAKNLTNINFRSNGLTGSVPSISANTALQYFYFYSNSLTGSIPSLSANTALIDLRCYSNSFTGSIPSLSANTALQTFRCATNQLSGSIPSFSSNTVLSYFDCNTNQLTGSIPSLSSNTSLATLRCHTNQLTGFAGGTIPTSLTDFQAQNNLLTQSAVDAILVAFDTAGHSGAYTLNVGGTGNATPSATGLTAKSNLQGKGWTVTTN